MAGKEKFPPRERSFKARRERALRILLRLGEVYPDARCSLNHRNAFELLVATVLSAQTTDERVNSVTPQLFSLFPDAESMAAAEENTLREILRPIGFFRTKAHCVKTLAQTLLEKYGGTVPHTLEELIQLRGVGRKTANVVLGNAFSVPGITVDTHVGRIARRWGWTRQTDPVKAEMELNRLLPPKMWTVSCHRIIAHGRAICHARNPKCGICPFSDLCPSYPLLSGTAAQTA